MEQKIDKAKVEKNAANSLLERGINVKIGKRTYHMKQPTIGMLDELALCQLEMSIDEDQLRENSLTESKVLVRKNAGLMAKAVAIFLAGPIQGYNIPVWKKISKVLWRLKVKRFQNLVYNTVTPSHLLDISLTIFQLSNTPDFTNSTRLQSAVRITAPKADQVEQQV